MSGLWQSMQTLIETFHKYSDIEGDSKTLTRGELSELLHNEMPIAECKCQHEVCEFFNTLDQNKDGVIEFVEYVTFVATLTAICQKG